MKQLGAAEHVFSRSGQENGRGRPPIQATGSIETSIMNWRVAC